MASSKRNLGRAASKGTKKPGRSTGNDGRAHGSKTVKKAPRAAGKAAPGSKRPTHAQDRSSIEVLARGVLIRGSRVLLCQSVKGGHWYLPGGHVEFGEPAAAALRRELQEEAGLDVRVLGVIQVDEHSFDTRKRRHHELNIVFHVEPAPGATDRQLDRIRSKEPGITFAWVDLAAVVDLNVVPMTAKALLVAGGLGGVEAGAMPRAGNSPDVHGMDWISAMNLPE